MKLANKKLNFWGFGSVIKKHSERNVISNITSARSSVGSDGKEYDAFLDRENLVTNIRIKKPSRKKSKNFSPILFLRKKHQRTQENLDEKLNYFIY